MSDRRIERTEKMIKTAFVELVNEVGFSKVTVTAISKRAMINRLTFYRHYQDKYQLAAQMMQQFLQGFKKALDLRFELADADRKDRAFLTSLISDNMREMLQTNQTTVTALFAIQTDTLNLRTEVRQAIQQKYRTFFNGTGHDSETIELEALMVGSLVMGVIDFFLKHQRLPEMAQVMAAADHIFETMR